MDLSGCFLNFCAVILKKRPCLFWHEQRPFTVICSQLYRGCFIESFRILFCLSVLNGVSVTVVVLSPFWNIFQSFGYDGAGQPGPGSHSGMTPVNL